MKHSIIRLFVGLIVMIVAAMTAYASEHPKSSVGATRIDAHGPNATIELSRVLVGSGVKAIDSAVASPTAGGSIYWAKTRDKTDERGNRHVFYQQMYAPENIPGAAVSSVADLGVELDGTSLGLHYNENGRLLFVFGTQFEDVVNVSVPMIGQRIDAFSSAQVRASERPEFSPAGAGVVPTRVIANDLERARLILKSNGDGTTFRYEWRVPIRDAEGLLHIAKLDAETSALVSLRSAVKFDSCGYDTNDLESADGVPQNSSISPRNIWATETDDWGEDYTHEAHTTPNLGHIPPIQVLYRDADRDDDCDWNGGDKYSLMPIKTDGSTPTYNDYTSPDVIPGKAGTDALYFTFKTMTTFDDLGRNGWDGSGTLSNILVAHNEESDTRCPGGLQDTSFFNHDQWWANVPDNAVVHCQKVSQSYNEAAAIDIVAHEWGHGVLFDEVGWEDAGEEEDFQEGWADVIGHIVEWQNQSSGSTAEKAEWKFGEDRGNAWRRVDTYSSRVCPDDECESFHADDPEDGSEEHAVGNRLPVAFRLMSVGGENSICDEYDYLDGCGTDVTDIGVSDAGEIMFYTVENILADAADWYFFGQMAKAAAYILYSNCYSYAGTTEQTSAHEAFTAIGHEPYIPIMYLCF